MDMEKRFDLLGFKMSSSISIARLFTCSRHHIFKWCLCEPCAGLQVSRNLESASFLYFFLSGATLTAKYPEWRGSTAPPFCSRATRSGLWILASPCWRTQLWRSTASKSKTSTSTMKGLMSAPSSPTRNRNPLKSTSSFKVGQKPRNQQMGKSTTTAFQVKSGVLRSTDKSRIRQAISKCLGSRSCLE